mmetsp:Transcript_126510/g.246620  ORF Transcript_126510/g.246620 Transcript_126510/m.246620 type:complete len:435 (+) Transcript_126510:121-1425(+)
MAAMGDTLDFDSFGQQPPFTLVGVLLPLGLGALLVLLLQRRQKRASSSSSLKLSAGSVGRVVAGNGTCKAKVFGLSPQDCPTSFLRANDEQLEWFCGIAQRSNDMQHGIFIAADAATEEPMPGWTAGDFKSALLKMRNCLPEKTWPHGGQLHEPLDDVAFAARLIASELDVDKAARLIREYATFRQDTANGGGVAPTREWLECGIVFVPCEDFLGRPVVNIRPRYHRPGNPDLFRLGLRSTLDALKAHYMHQRGTTFSETNPLEQYVMIWDFAGASMWKNLDWDAFHVTLQEGAKHYPNMGSQIYVLNVSAPVRWVWTAASKFMHPRVRRKCILVAPADVPSCMRRIVPVDQLPPVWGGTGPAWPGPAEAKTLEDQVGSLVASAYRRAGVVPAGAKPSREDLMPGSIAPPREREKSRGRGKSLGELSCFACFGL